MEKKQVTEEMRPEIFWFENIIYLHFFLQAYSEPCPQFITPHRPLQYVILCTSE